MQQARSIELKAIAGQVKPHGSKNIRPGDNMGLNTEQVRDYIKRQKRCKGERFNLATGGNPGLQVQLSGTARVFLGFALTFPSGSYGKLSLKMNNETIIDGVAINFFSSNFTDEEYFFIPRPLSGQDDISFSVDDVNAPFPLDVVLYYL